jgi:protein tyrosine/serine phosphatase
MSESVEQHGDATLIIPRIWLGNKRAAADSDFLQRQNIQTVFNCTKDLPFSPRIQPQHQYRVPVDDNLEAAEIRNMAQWSPEIVHKFLQEYRQGNNILVHCHAGMQRSAAVLAMVMIAMYGYSAEQVMTFIRSKRPIAFFPEANFKAAILGFEQSLRASLASRRGHNGGR